MLKSHGEPRWKPTGTLSLLWVACLKMESMVKTAVSRKRLASFSQLRGNRKAQKNKGRVLRIDHDASYQNIPKL